MGLRSPLSPLPLAELLGEGMNGNVGAPSPMPVGFEAGLQSPDLFSMWSMPWTPQSGFGGLPLPVPPPNPLVTANAPGTPLGGFQGLSPALPVYHATAPPAAFGGGPL